MLPFFPTPYPDELLYSIFARYHYRSCNSTIKETVCDLFGSRNACAVFDFPSRLSTLCSRLPPRLLLTPKVLIDKHTLFPLFRPFLPKVRARKLATWMEASDSGKKIHTSIGVMASSFPKIHYLRYCQVCLRRDVEKFGEPYWHRSHQVPAVCLCHKHAIPLTNSEVAVSAPMNKHAFISLQFSGREEYNKQLQSAGASDFHHLKLAESVHWLLSHPNKDAMGLSDIRRRYIYHLQKRKLSTYFGKTDQLSLAKQFLAYYGDQFLEDVHSLFFIGQQDTWLSAQLRFPRKAAHPIRHLLLINFLNLTLERYFDEKPYHPPPFGRGPWPCLNPAATHYHQRIIGHCDISKNSETGAPVGNFTCICGFSYARTGPDHSAQDRYRLNRIISVGPVWEQELVRLMVDEKKSLRATARYLSVDPKTVKLHMAGMTVNDLDTSTMANKVNLQLWIRRYRWISHLRDNPDMGLTTLRRLSAADYKWLYRHDSRWLINNVPSCHKKHPKSRVDWEMRDRQIAKDIIDAVDKIKRLPGKPLKLTVSAIGRVIGKLALLQKEIKMLPLTQKALKDIVETNDTFALRRVRYAFDVIHDRGEALVGWKLVRLAGVGRYKSAAIVEEINKICSAGIRPDVTTNQFAPDNLL